jgi:hypothetical protein
MLTFVYITKRKPCPIMFPTTTPILLQNGESKTTLKPPIITRNLIFHDLFLLSKGCFSSQKTFYDDPVIKIKML